MVPRLTYLAATLALAIALSLSETALAEAVHVGVGQKQFINLPDHAQSVQIEKAGIVSVDRGATRGVLVITGKAAGSTPVTVVLENGQTLEYTVDVGTRVAARGLESVVARLRQISGLGVETKGDRVYLKGVVTTRLDRQTIADLKSDNPGLIVDGTEQEIYESNTVVRTINRVLAENDIANLQTHAYGQHIVLEGSPRDDQQLLLAMKIAKAIYPSVEDNVSKTSNGAPSIAIEVLFVEAQRKNDKTFGVSGIQDSFAGTAQALTGNEALSGKLKPYSGTRTKGKNSLVWQVGPLNAFLQLIETRTASRVLSNPRLVSRSGQEATFLSGGTFFLQTLSRDPSGAFVGQLLPVNYGIELAIQPKLDAIGQIDSKIRTSISDIGDAVASMPSVTKSSVETAVTIKNGQSILLSGLVRKTDNKKVERVPFLADIPIIGELFKSRNLVNDETEMLVIVTMRRVAGADERSNAASQLYDKAGDDVEFSIFD